VLKVRKMLSLVGIKYTIPMNKQAKPIAMVAISFVNKGFGIVPPFGVMVL
jgi:flagellar basal body P-ring protein FlgI